MKLIAIPGLLTIATLSLTAPQAIAFSVTQTSNPTQIQNTLFGEAPGLNITRFDIGTEVTGGYGQFSQGGFLGLDRGLVMSTGEPQSIARPNCANGASPDLACNPLKPGADLNYNFVTYDQTGKIITGDPLDELILDIAFDAPQSGSLNLSYVFGSEEFPEFRLGQMLGDDIFYIMLADQNGKVPFQQAISISSIVNAKAFKNNPVGSREMALDGYTDPISLIIPFQAQQQYRLILGIQDAQVSSTVMGADGKAVDIFTSDDGYDSAVFLQQISVKMDQPPSIPTPSLLFGFTWMGWRRWRDRRKSR
jgi:hypothetical protein